MTVRELIENLQAIDNQDVVVVIDTDGVPGEHEIGFVFDGSSDIYCPRVSLDA